MVTESRRDSRSVRPPRGWVEDVPSDPAEWMAFGEPTYGGKTMRNPLPTREEYMFMYWLSNAVAGFPVHDKPGAPA